MPRVTGFFEEADSAIDIASGAALVVPVQGSVVFDLARGGLTARGGRAAIAMAGRRVSPTQVSTWAALYDDLMDPGEQNVSIGNAGGLEVRSGIVSDEVLELRDALALSFAPGGFNGMVLARLAPTSYLALGGYAHQANRSHRLAVLGVPGMPVAPADGAKDAKLGLPDEGLAWEWLAGLTHFRARDEGNIDLADSRMDGGGVVGWVRCRTPWNLVGTAYLGLDDDRLRGPLMKTDAKGWTLGALAEMRIEAPAPMRVRTGFYH